ncbi:MAG: hypothetical protein DRP56_10690 [Planctomycetota bacterium]|nr:MAG: hypothetical protein DRP56_10690 [Planctomycetota bacterium]
MISVVTLVTKLKEYRDNVIRTMSSEDVIPIHNAPSAAVGLNTGIRKAKHEIVVCCHQDVVFPPLWAAMLYDQIELISDPSFGVLGTFGAAEDSRLVGHVSDPHNNPKMGDLPCRAMSLDEHCLVIRKSSGLLFDENLSGFHMYGADICLSAQSKKMCNYVIDAPVVHLSGGKVDPMFKICVMEFKRKWQNRSPIPVIRTTCGQFFLN